MIGHYFFDNLIKLDPLSLIDGIRQIGPHIGPVGGNGCYPQIVNLAEFGLFGHSRSGHPTQLGI